MHFILLWNSPNKIWFMNKRFCNAYSSLEHSHKKKLLTSRCRTALSTFVSACWRFDSRVVTSVSKVTSAKTCSFWKWICAYFINWIQTFISTGNLVGRAIVRSPIPSKHVSVSWSSWKSSDTEVLECQKYSDFSGCTNLYMVYKHSSSMTHDERVHL